MTYALQILVTFLLLAGSVELSVRFMFRRAFPGDGAAPEAMSPGRVQGMMFSLFVLPPLAAFWFVSLLAVAAALAGMVSL